jgi:hypothetical protein
VHRKAADPLGDVMGEIGLAEFAVINAVEPARDLARDGVGDVLTQGRFQQHLIDGRAGGTSPDHARERLRARQGAGMGGADSVDAHDHAFALETGEN